MPMMMPDFQQEHRTLLSYAPQSLPLKAGSDRLLYLFEANHASLPLYFALKCKHGYALANREAFVDAVRAVVAEVAQNYSQVVYPQSRVPFLSDLVAQLPNAVELAKRSKTDIIELAQESARWSKLERQSQARAWAEMGDTFTINLIKSNQRKHYVPYLFEPIDVPPGNRVLLLDDFIMSGNTIAAGKAALGLADCDCFGIFYQPAFSSA